MTATPAHEPVLLRRCLEWLVPGGRPGGWIVDGTFGAGGHTRALLGAGASVLAIDQDPEVERFAADLPGERFRWARGNFRDLAEIVGRSGVGPVRGVLLDLGVSSMQIDDGARGFAFRSDGPLDMRMSGRGETAAELLARLTMPELAAILYRYGEERHSRRIAREIVRTRDERSLRTTGDLVAAVQRAYPAGPRSDHPARRTFQALRIYLNDELGALEAGLAGAAVVVEPGGRIVVVAYHSLEDRIVKRTFRDDPRLAPLTRRPETPDPDEIDANPRARSAKLRAAEKVTP